MDFPPLRKSSFKSRHTRRPSGGGSGSGSGSGAGGIIDSISHEETPILSLHHQQSHDHHDFNDRSTNNNQQSSAIMSSSSSDVIVKVLDEDNNPNNSMSYSYPGSSSTSSFAVQREPSFEHQRQQMAGTEDPPSKLIREFMDKQRNYNGGEIALDMDYEMDDVNINGRRTSPDCQQFNVPKSNDQSPYSKRSSREVRVSFEPSVSGVIDSAADSIRRRYKDVGESSKSPSPYQQQQKQKQRTDEVLRCTSNALRREANMLSRVKTRSRILDPAPEEMERMSGRIPKSGGLRSGQMRSGLLSRISDDDDDDDDPLQVEDLPEEYTKAKMDALTVIQWVSLIVITTALICSLSIHSLKEKKIMDLKLWKWEVLLLVLICGRLVSGWGIRLIVFFIERNFLLRKRVLYFVYGLRKGVQNCWWLGLVLLAWHLLFDKKVERQTNSNFLKYVTKILVCFLVANFIWLLKTLLVKVLASSFHVSTYFDRIQESIFNQFVIETLSGPPLIELRRNELEEERTAAEVRKLQKAGAPMPPDLRAAVFPPGKSGRLVGKSFRGKSIKIGASGPIAKQGEDQGFSIDHLHKLNPKNVSAWNMKRLMKIVKNGSLSTLDEQIMGASDDTITEIRSEHEAKAAARKIFYNVARPNAKYIYFEDLLRFMREDEALKTMGFFEGGSETSKISKSSLKNWVVNAFRERRALALTLNDTKTAVNRLHHLVNIVVSVIILIIWLLILGIATSKFFVVLGSQVVVVSFIFGNTAKTLFESIIFLFFIHPFDVGDRCEVDGVQMLVEEMNILTTVFLRADNQKIIFPNSVLATKPIGNFYRSPDMGDSVEFLVHISTPTEKIAEMRQRIISYIENKKEHWYPNPMVILKELEELNKLRIAVWFRHRMNHQDMGEKWSRRALLLEEMVRIFKDLDIQYRLFPIDVNVKTVLPLN